MLGSARDVEGGSASGAALKLCTARGCPQGDPQARSWVSGVRADSVKGDADGNAWRRGRQEEKACVAAPGGLGNAHRDSAARVDVECRDGEGEGERGK